ncbi:uncharacterized protein N7511_005622 [Penicillium nucicola]|uniref:uncharacterized protein n=1 Tax=Penicillium nucicola TaxID=1850975 RepID=UPI00254595B2|nr:uncharacterized protein N7511_005622 [Penicillium nucicola]KAJ5762240.1 hypothetical protein N7511_005622 [Penicillium nucicola]
MQNSPNLKRLSEYLSNSTLSGPLDLTADPTTLPDIETRELSSYFYHALRGGAPSKKGPATAHKVPGQNTRIITTKPPTNIGRAGRTKLADHTKKYIPTVLRSAGPAGQLGYKVGPGLIGPLKPEMEEFLDLSTRVVVVNGDTYDVAVALHNARDIMEHEDPMPVCVLNFANAFTIGGGWKNGSPAQEEQLCYRSTLTATLLPRLYPMETKELIYSPQVSILRESEKRGYHMMWPNAQSPLPVVSVISMAAQSKPTVTAANKYQNISDRNLMKDKMRMVLRTAAHNRHQRLVLGALGCGAFGHPKQEVADCWKEVLEDVEFQGFFELIVFAIFDPGNDGNFPVFHQTLHNLDMFYEATQ